jgi:hypothetical protein
MTVVSRSIGRVVNARGILLLSLICLLSACAGVHVSRLESDADYRGGVRFYRPEPYILVTADSDTDKLKGTIVWLPNMKKEYVVTWTTGLGTVSPGITLQDGWNLTGLAATADSKTAEIMTAISGVLSSVRTKGIRAIDGPGIYRLVFNPASGELAGIKRVIE